jgi:hypothetical protein
VNLVARNIQRITGIQYVLFITKAQARAAMENVHTMIMGMLVERGMAARLHSKVAQVKVR